MGEPAIGTVIDARYELEALIGRGGMGTVWRARHRFTQVHVALKILHANLVVEPDILQRFLDEARAASVIGHPAIVEVGDANRMPDGSLYLAMELLQGRSLRTAIEGGLDGEDVRRIGLELLDALAAAHARGFVHRDLKPENIFLVAPTGAVKLLDFGIAKVLGADARTLRGRLLGTLEYMAPEQLHDASQVDPRADLWAVGIILYEMLSGLRPFGGSTPEEKYRALASDEPVPITEVVPTTPEVAAFFLRVLARDRSQRFGSAAEMAHALRGLALSPARRTQIQQAGPTLGSGQAWTNAPTHVAATAAAPKQRGVAIVAAIVAVVALVVAIIVIAGMTRGGDTTRPSSDAAVIAEIPDACHTACTKLAGCKLAMKSCEADCRHKQILLDCIEPANTCDELTACVWRFTCGSSPAGPKTCRETLDCQTDCNMDSRCRCGCVIAMKATSATLLAKLFTCRTDCGSDNKCFIDSCTEHVNRCFAD
ncbi:MAG: serine/threonine-protein kinase [Kofleriaceae bacterium]